MDDSDNFTHALSRYKGQKIKVIFNTAGQFKRIPEGILGDIFSDGFFMDIGRKSPSIIICYLRNVSFVHLVDE